MKFEEELRRLFRLHHFTPSTEADSECVRKAFEEQCAASLTPADLREDHLPDAGVFTPFDLLKYIAKKHGLPGSFCRELVARFDGGSSATVTPRHMAEMRFQIAQLIRLALERDSGFISIADCITLLQLQVKVAAAAAESTGGANGPDPQTVLAHLAQCVLIKVLAPGFGEGDGAQTESCRGKLLKIIPHFDKETQAVLRKALGAWKALAAQSTAAQGQLLGGDGEASGDLRPGLVALDQQADGTGGDIFGFGAGMMRDGLGGMVAGRRAQAQAHAVKTQAVVATSVKHNVSEKSELEAISLSAALSAGRNAAKSATVEKALEPAVSTRGGSDRSWWRTTGWEIGNFLTMAEGKSPLKSEDIVWLKDKTRFDRDPRNLLVGKAEMNRIGRIFAAISEFQVLPDEVVNALANNLFGRELKTYDYCRLNLLKVFENHARRQKCLPERAQKTLLKFKDASDCNTEMRRLIWKITMKDDGRLEETFAMALKQLTTKDEEAGDDGVGWAKAAEDALDYIASQVVIEHRAIELEKKIGFSTVLLRVVLNADGQFPAKVRRQAAEVVESLVAHPSMKEGQCADWLDVYQELYEGPHVYEPTAPSPKAEETFGSSLLGGRLSTFHRFTPSALIADGISRLVTGRSLYDSGETSQGEGGGGSRGAESSWPPNERRDFQAAVIRTILHTLDKYQDTVERDRPSEKLLEFLVDLCTRNQDPRLESYIVISLGNLVIRCGLRIPCPDRLAPRLVRRDAVDRNGLLFLTEEEEDGKKGNGLRGRLGHWLARAGPGPKSGSGSSGSNDESSDSENESSTSDSDTSAGNQETKTAKIDKDKDAFGDDGAPDEGLQHISHFVATILLRAVIPDPDSATNEDEDEPEQYEFEESTIDCLLNAVKDAGAGRMDKNTRITCAECLFQASTSVGQRLELFRLDSVRALTLDPVLDVSVYMTVVYCQQLWMHFGQKESEDAGGESEEDADERSENEEDEGEIEGGGENDDSSDKGEDSIGENEEDGGENSETEESDGENEDNDEEEVAEDEEEGEVEVIAPEDLRWLVKLYAHDGSLELGARNFVQYVNGPILEVLKSQAPHATFSDEVFQLLAHIIAQAGADQNGQGQEETGKSPLALCVQVLGAHIDSSKATTRVRSMPAYCLEAVEHAFLAQEPSCSGPGGPSLYRQTLRLLYVALTRLRMGVSDATVAHAYHQFVGYTTFNEETLLQFEFLIDVFLLQGLPQHVFEAIDIEFIAIRLVHELHSRASAEETSEGAAEPDVDWALLADCVPSHLKLTSEEKKGTRLQELLTGAMNTFVAYGRPLSTLDLALIRQILRRPELELGPALACLLNAVQNEQSLPPGLVELVFSKFRLSSSEVGQESGEGAGKKQLRRNLELVSLATGLVSIHQTLPAPFVRVVLHEFCEGKGPLGEDPLQDRIFLLVSKLLQEQGVGVSAAEQEDAARVTARLCDLWQSCGGNKTQLQVVSAWQDSKESRARSRKAFEGQAKSEDEYAAFLRLLTAKILRRRLRRLAGFWKTSRNQSHRLEILTALTFAASGCTEPEGKGSRAPMPSRVYLAALQDANQQIARAGLQAFITLPSNLVRDADFRILIEVQRRPDTSGASRDAIQTFLERNADRLPEGVKEQFSFWADLNTAMENESNLRSETVLGMLEKTPHATLAHALQENDLVSKALTSVLQNGRGGDELALHAQTRVAALLHRLPPDAKRTLSRSLLDSVAFVVANLRSSSQGRKAKGAEGGSRSGALLDLDAASRELIGGLVELRIRFSTTFVEYLSLCPEYFDLILAIHANSDNSEAASGVAGAPAPDGLGFKMRVHAFLEAIEGGNAEGLPGQAHGAQRFFTQLPDSDSAMALDAPTLTKFLEVVPAVVLQSSRVADLFAASLLQADPDLKLLTRLSDTQASTFAGVIEAAILNPDWAPSTTATPAEAALARATGFHTSVLVAYRALLAEGLMTCGAVEPCLSRLANWAVQCVLQTEPEQEMRILTLTAILKCFLEAAALSQQIATLGVGDGAEAQVAQLPGFIPTEAVEVVLALFSDPRLLPAQRELCFLTLDLLDVRGVAVATPSARHALKQEIDQVLGKTTTFALGVCKQVLGGEGPEPDEGFVKRLASCLLSLGSWDVHSLKRQPPARWRQTLVVSDFLSTFAGAGGQEEQIRVVLALNALYKAHGAEVAETLCQNTGARFAGRPAIAIDHLLSTLSALPQTRSFHIFWKCSASPAQTLAEELEAAFVEQELMQKLEQPISAEVLHVLQQKFMAALGGDSALAQLLLDKLAPLRDASQLETLVAVLSKHKDKYLFAGAAREVKPAFCVDLHAAPDASMSVADIRALLESHILLGVCPSYSTVDKASLLHLLSPALGIPFQSILQLLEILRARHAPDKPSDFNRIAEHVLAQASKYSASPEVFAQLVSAIKCSDSVLCPPDVITASSNILNQHAFGGGERGMKNTSSVVEEFWALNKQALEGVPESEFVTGLEKAILLIQRAKQSSVVLPEEPPICEWSRGNVRRWAEAHKVAREVGAGTLPASVEDEILLVAKHAFKLCTGFVLTHVQLLAILMGLNSAEAPQGQLLQVATGSGKSGIIAIISAFLCLRHGGKTVDVYTSSGVLAERDAREWASFYALFGLTCDHNGDRGENYLAGPKPCYTKNIVYGECAQFQFDALRHNYSALGTLAGRGCDFAVVDEVDSMFIDDGSKLARLSSTLPGMDLLHLPYHLIWDRLTFVKAHLFRIFDEMYYMEGQAQAQAQTPEEKSAPPAPPVVSYSFAENTGDLVTIDNVVAYILGGGDLAAARIHAITNLEEFVTDHLTRFSRALISREPVPGFSAGGEPRIKLPGWLAEYGLAQVDNWVSSAITALLYQENVHYVVSGGVVQPVDYATTGVVQALTNWSNGLHQFLQLKHGLRIGSESVTTNFLSNTAMFQKYGPRLLGFTGTLGSDACRRVLQEVYGVGLLIVPETHHKKYLRFPDHVAESEAAWLREVLVGVLEEVAKRRGVLVIAQTIKEADLISGALGKFKHMRVKSYTKNAENQEKQIERILPGDVFVATNLAGRGTDIKASDLEAFGGLHVLLTFLPPSLRVEEQAFGRTSRQGKAGSGQLVIWRGADAHAGGGAAAVREPVGADRLRTERDAKEAAALEHFQATQLVLIRTKDKLFEQFCALFARVRRHIQEQRRSDLTAVKERVKAVVNWTTESVLGSGRGAVVNTFQPPTPDEAIILQAVEQRWAMLLRGLDDGTLKAEEAQGQYDAFAKELQADIEAGGVDARAVESLIRRSGNAFYFIQLGNFGFSQDSKFGHHLEEAVRHYEAALTLEPAFAAGARVGLAYSALTGSRGVFWDSHGAGYKEAALEQLQLAEPLLVGELALVTFAQSLAKKFGGDDLNSDLFKQHTEKANLLGSFLKNVQANKAVIERCLRRVTCTGQEVASKEPGTPTIWERRQVENRIIQAEGRSLPWRDYGSYELTFADLTHFKDGHRVTDQAVNTLKEGLGSKLFGRSPKLVSLACPNASLSRILACDKIMAMNDSCDFDLDVEISNFELELLAEEKLGQLGVLKPASMTLELFPTDPTRPWALGDPLLDWIVTNPALELEVTARVEVNIPEEDFWGVGELRIDRKGSLDVDVRKELEEFSTGKADAKSLKLKLTGIESMDKVAALLNKLASFGIGAGAGAGTGDLRASLTLHSVHPPKPPKTNGGSKAKEKKEKEDEERAKWAEGVDGYTSGFNSIEVRLARMKPDSAIAVIEQLRGLGVDFSLSCSGLDFKAAQALLQKADLAQEDIQLQGKYKELVSLYMADCLPLAEVRDLAARGICIMVGFSERQFVPWVSIRSVVGLAALQAGAGAFLICTGFGATVGMGLVTEAMADLVTAQRIYTSRHFSWSEYAVQKAVSVAISCASMGLSAFKDSAKGLSLLGQSAAKEGAEQAAGKAIVGAGQKTLNYTATHASKNLQSLSGKFVAVSLVETGVKIGLRTLTDAVTDFAFDQMRPALVEHVSGTVRSRFGHPELEALLSFYYALDPSLADLRPRVLTAVADTTNPKASKWLSLWSTVGAPLSNGILSSPQFLGSIASRANLALGIITGVKQIATVIDKVCAEVQSQLSSQKPDTAKILQTIGGLSKETAREMAAEISFKPRLPGNESDFVLEKKPSMEVGEPSERAAAKRLFKRLAKAQTRFSPREDTGLSQLLRQVVDVLVDHLIQVGNSTLVSPVTSQLVGSLVAKISAELQDRFVCSEAEAGQEGSGGAPRTVTGQIRANAKDYMVAHQRRALAARAMEAASKAGTDGADGQAHATPSPEAKKAADGALNGAPANMAIMFSLAAENDIKIKIVAPDYEPTEQDKADGVNLVVFTPGKDGDIGHYSLMDPVTKEPVDIPSSPGGDRKNDCGFDVLAHLSEGAKTSAELRTDAHDQILGDPAKFEEIQAVTDWLVDRSPNDANDMLLIGGRKEKWKDTEYPWHFNPEEEALHAKLQMNNPDVQKRLEKGPTPKDREGTVYQYTKEGTEDESGLPLTKVGRTYQEPPEDRIDQQEREGKYTDKRTVQTQDHKTVESLAHKMGAYSRETHTKPDGGKVDGGTECFRENPDQLAAYVDLAKTKVEGRGVRKEGPQRPKDDPEFKKFVQQVHKRYKPGDEDFKENKKRGKR